MGRCSGDARTLQSQGLSQRAIAREVGLDRRTIARYFRLQHLPPRAPTPQAKSAASAYLPYMMKRWDAGCCNRRELFEEIQAQGFAGSYASVWRATRHLSPQSMGSSQLPYAAPRNAAWLLMCPETRLTDDEQHTRTRLREHSAHIHAAYTLAQRPGRRSGTAAEADHTPDVRAGQVRSAAPAGDRPNLTACFTEYAEEPSWVKTLDQYRPITYTGTGAQPASLRPAASPAGSCQTIRERARHVQLRERARGIPHNMSKQWRRRIPYTSGRRAIQKRGSISPSARPR